MSQKYQKYGKSISILMGILWTSIYPKNIRRVSKTDLQSMGITYCVLHSKTIPILWPLEKAWYFCLPAFDFLPVDFGTALDLSWKLLYLKRYHDIMSTVDSILFHLRTSFSFSRRFLISTFVDHSYEAEIIWIKTFSSCKLVYFLRVFCCSANISET